MFISLYTTKPIGLFLPNKFKLRPGQQRANWNQQRATSMDIVWHVPKKIHLKVNRERSGIKKPLIWRGLLQTYYLCRVYSV